MSLTVAKLACHSPYHLPADPKSSNTHLLWRLNLQRGRLFILILIFFWDIRMCLSEDNCFKYEHCNSCVIMWMSYLEFSYFKFQETAEVDNATWLWKTGWMFWHYCFAYSILFKNYTNIYQQFFSWSKTVRAQPEIIPLDHKDLKLSHPTYWVLSRNEVVFIGDVSESTSS